MQQLLHLLYIDIAYSLINDIDFRGSVSLLKLVKDKTQNASINSYVMVIMLDEVPQIH